MKKVKRVAAIIGIVLILSMYLVTFISSFFTSKYTHGLFLASVYCTFVVPVLIYAFMLIYRLVAKLSNSNNPKGSDHRNGSGPAAK